MKKLILTLAITLSGCSLPPMAPPQPLAQNDLEELNQDIKAFFSSRDAVCNNGNYTVTDLIWVQEKAITCKQPKGSEWP